MSSESSDHQQRSFKTCLIITISLTAVGMGIILGIIFLLGRYVFHDPPSFWVTNFSFDSSSTVVSVTLAVRNYNSNTLVGYDSISASLSYGGDPVATTTVAPFDQGKDVMTAVEARFTITNRNFDCGSTFDKPFSVKVSTTARYVNVNVRKVKTLTASCDDIWVGCQNATTASMLATDKYCHVHEN